MFTPRYGSLTRFLDRTVRDDASVSDRELLERFARSHDEAAFEALVKRHGGVVQQVCRRLRLDEHAADDVFQSMRQGQPRFRAVLLFLSNLSSDLYLISYVVTDQTYREEAEAATAQSGPDPSRTSSQSKDQPGSSGPTRNVKNGADTWRARTAGPGP